MDHNLNVRAKIIKLLEKTKEIFMALIWQQLHGSNTKSTGNRRKKLINSISSQPSTYVIKRYYQESKKTTPTMSTNICKSHVTRH